MGCDPLWGFWAAAGAEARGWPQDAAQWLLMNSPQRRLLWRDRPREAGGCSVPGWRHRGLQEKGNVLNF